MERKHDFLKKCLDLMHGLRSEPYSRLGIQPGCQSEALSVALATWEDGTGQRRGLKRTPQPVLMAVGLKPVIFS